MTIDTVIKDGKIVSPWEILSASIAIDRGKIVAIGAETALPKARKTINAKGNYILPGIIDTHTHPGYGHSLEEDTRIDSAAAAYGGVTTMGIMIGGGYNDITHRGSYTEIFDTWRDIIEKNTFTDFLIDFMFYAPIQIEEIPIYAKKYGVTTFKMHMIEMPDDGALYTALQKVAELGLPARLLIHCENSRVIDRMTGNVKTEDRTDSYAQWADTRPGWAEAMDVDKAAVIAKQLNSPIYIVHLSSAAGVRSVARAKEDGVDIIAETCPSYLTLTKDTPLKAVAKVVPPLRDRESIEALWQGINSGIIDCIGTDNISGLTAKKRDIWSAVSGNPGIEHFLPLMLSEGVNKGRIRLQKLVEVCSTNNAKAMGIFPQKGIIQIGSDADLVIVDINKKMKLSAKTDHMATDYCLWEGWRVQGWPVLTMLRGNVVVEEEILKVKQGIGKYLPRLLPKKI
jgi:dihydropyrimidinase